MAANDNFTQPEQGTMQKIRNIGANLQEKLAQVLKEAIDIHAAALDEIFKEIEAGKHKGGSVEYYEKIMQEKVRRLSCGK